MANATAERGSALILVLISSIILASMVGALTMLSQTESRMVLDVRLLENARQTADAGLNLVVEEYQQDQLPPPRDWYVNAQPFGGGTYQILEDNDLGGILQRRYIQMEGVYNEADWQLEAIIGPVVKPLFDSAIQANSDITMVNNPGVDSYHSGLGPYDAANPRDNGDIRGNASLDMNHNSDVLGDVEVDGAITIDGNSSVSGESTPDGDSVYIPSVDALVDQMVTELSASNDNAFLDPSIVTLVDGDPAVQLGVNRARTISAGDYYLHGISTGMNSTLVFDTTAGPIRIVVHTDDVYLSRNSHFYVHGDNPVYIYLSGFNKFEMDNLSSVTNSSYRGDLFQVVINSNDPGHPRFDMGQRTDFYGTVLAPDVDVSLAQNSALYGAVVGRQVSLANYSTVHYDEALMEGRWLLVPDSYRVYFKRRLVTG